MALVRNCTKTDCHIVFANLARELKDNVEYTITVKEYVKSRTLDQNSYLWGVIYEMAGKKLGYDVDTIHEVFKAKFGYKLTLRNGDQVPRSTKSYTTVEMGEYIDKIVIFCAEFLKLVIPEPKNN